MKFNLFGPAYLVKSGDTSSGEPIKIGGRISTEARDADGEKLLTEGLDFSYFDKGYGKIKYEHDSPLNKEPDNIIGFPTTVKKGRTYVDFQGELVNFHGIPDELLTPQQRAAKSAYGLIKSVEEHNRRNPKIKQNVGWSIEGEYIDRDSGSGIVKQARITGVVLTTKPKNTETFAELVKSLEVGHETDSAEKTGYGATTRESIDKKIKTTKEKSVMNEKEFYQSCLDKGMTEEEAKKATEEWKMKQEAGGDVEKGNKAKMKKAEEGEDVDEESKEAEEELEEVEKSLSKLVNTGVKIDIAARKSAMKKSVNVGSEDPDLLDIFESQNDAQAAALEYVDILNHKVDIIAKSVATITKSLQVILKGDRQVRKGVKLNNAAVGKMLKAAGNSGVLTSDLLKGISFEDNDTQTGQPTYAEMHKAITALFDEGKVSGSAVVRFESTRGYMDKEVASLVKSRVNEFRK